MSIKRTYEVIQREIDNVLITLKSLEDLYLSFRSSFKDDLDPEDFKDNSELLSMLALIHESQSTLNRLEGQALYGSTLTMLNNEKKEKDNPFKVLSFDKEND